MNKIIKGKRYDTDTAKEIAKFSNDLSKSDFGWVRETLFRKRTGEYFLYGEGGALTKYSEYVEGSGHTWGARIKPLSVDEAKEWAEDVLDADEYEEIFGKTLEGKIKLTLSLEAEAVELLKQMALEAGKGIGETVEELVRNA